MAKLESTPPKEILAEGLKLFAEDHKNLAEDAEDRTLEGKMLLCNR